MNSIHPLLQEFVSFCVERRGKEWPAIYDEMASVARQRSFRDMGYDELKLCGLSLCLSNTDRLRQIIKSITAEHAEPIRQVTNRPSRIALES